MRNLSIRGTQGSKTPMIGSPDTIFDLSSMPAVHLLEESYALREESEMSSSICDSPVEDIIIGFSSSDKKV